LTDVSLNHSDKVSKKYTKTPKGSVVYNNEEEDGDIVEENAFTGN